MAKPLSDERLQQLLSEQDQRQETRTRALLVEQDQRQEERTKALLAEQKQEIVSETKLVVLDAIQQVVVPVLDEILETQKETLDRLETLEHRRDVQQQTLDDHDVRITALEQVRR